MPVEASERWFELAAKFSFAATPQWLSPERDRADSEVLPGQLRRAYWHHSVAMVLVVGVDEERAIAHIWPASLEAGVEDATTVVVDKAASPVSSDVSLWPTRQSTVPFAILDQTVASFSEPIWTTLVAHPEGTSDIGVRSGERDPVIGSGSAAAIDELFDAIETFESAPFFPTAEVAVPRKKLLIELPDVIGWLNVSQADAMSILLGKLPISPAQARVLSDCASISIEEIEASVSPLPNELRRELEEPRWRAAIRSRASDGDEEEARLELGYAAFQLAARQAAGEGREKWRQRIEAVLVRGR